MLQTGQVATVTEISVKTVANLLSIFICYAMPLCFLHLNDIGNIS